MNVSEVRLEMHSRIAITAFASAKMMAECDTGALPVGDNDRLVGVITDRDI